jgi:hypothetical protein
MLSRPILSVTFFAALFCRQMASQDASLQQFVGTWQASFKDKVFCTIQLQAGDKISGTFSAGHISVDDDGNLTEAEASESGETTPILKPSIEGDKLSFETEDGDDEALKFEMRITGEGQAELRFIGVPIRMNPIPFQRK